jgi:hypothetical protein
MIVDEDEAGGPFSECRTENLPGWTREAESVPVDTRVCIR